MRSLSYDLLSVVNYLQSFATHGGSFDDKIQELEIELSRAKSQTEHLRSQNEVLSLTLEDSKSITDRLTCSLGKLESNNTAFSLASSYCDQMIESYDILVALLETESGILSAATNNGNTNITWDTKRATSNRKSAETVAKHFLGRLEKSLTVGSRSDSGIGTAGSGSRTSTNLNASSNAVWEDSSGYSQTTRYTYLLNYFTQKSFFKN